MSSPAKKSVELFYDVISPYTWIGFETLCRYRQKWNIDLKFKPFFLGGIMMGADNKPPGTVPAKGLYMVHDVARLAKHYQIPLKQPENPGESIFGRAVSLPAMRFLTALNDQQPEKLEQVSRELMRRVWSLDKPINQPEYIAEAAKQAGVSDSVIKAALSNMGSSANKDKLKAVTEEALEYGAFGSPTVVITDRNNEKHMVFGSDRMPIIADLLGEKYEGPLTELATSKL